MFRRMCVIAVCVSLLAQAAAAQELQIPQQQPSGQTQPPEVAQPTKEHQWLAQFVGQWQTQSDCTRGPGEPPAKCQGAITCRMLGSLWLVNDVKTTMFNTPINAVQTIGYDTVKKKYIGTWVDSTMTHLWKYEGSVDASGKILTLEADGPSTATDGKPTRFRDTYEFKTPDRVMAKSAMLGDDGAWVTFMTGEMKRVK